VTLSAITFINRDVLCDYLRITPGTDTIYLYKQNTHDLLYVCVSFAVNLFSPLINTFNIFFFFFFFFTVLLWVNLTKIWIHD
jgi:hypothetical protein